MAGIPARFRMPTGIAGRRLIVFWALPRRATSRQRGQVIPLLALLMMVITGFAALAIDAGVSYDQARVDQDVADSAAVAAAYCVSDASSSHCDGTGQSDLQGAALAAVEVAYRDCTSPSNPCSVKLNFFSTYTPATDTGTVLCSASYVAPSTSPQSGTGSCLSSTDDSSIAYAGAIVSDTAVDDFANVGGGSRTHNIEGPQAVAEVQSVTTTPACEICDLGELSLTGSHSEIADNNGPIWIDGQITGWGTKACLYASSPSTSSNNCSTTAGTPFAIDLTAYSSASGLPGGFQSYPSPSYGASVTPPSPSPPDTYDSTTGEWITPDSSVTYTASSISAYDPATCPTDAVPEGIYSSVTLGVSGCDYSFRGYYMITGGLTIATNHVTMSGTANFYFLCSSGGQASTCGSSQAGGYFADDQNHTVLDLTAPGAGAASGILFYFDPNDEGQADSNCSGTATYAGYCGFDVSPTSGSGTHAIDSTGTSGELYMPGATLHTAGSYDNVLFDPIVAGNIIIDGSQSSTGYFPGPQAGGLVH
jgi:hypothetical protein